MTREEIKNTPELVDFMIDKCVLADSRIKVRKRLEEVCNLAIKALEQEPCEDCISREDAIANILVLFPDMPVVDIMGVRRKWAEKYAQYNDCIQILRELPPVTPKPKTGHWIKSKDGYMRCDRCGSRGSAIKARFCHHCGAKMVEPQERSE